ncbi:MAG TPA: hypothetical protein VFZ09_09010 [Archangium sp.]|uniref:hypothetical protein n=1 Tax=Archangium sp. TaxID=1872627 RepID=UPI002E3629D0|nr:hypothetical protein [Archangium sp.]HEX5746372.1 hypothetical protein [Archangium sp.]
MRAVLLALLLLPALASATDVRGTLSTSTVWTRRGSPYVLHGDVTVAWGTKLTIEPGVQVIAAASDALKSGVDPRRVELIVDGTLRVHGTAASPVELTSHGGSGAWYGIRVRGGRGTEIHGAVITQAHQGIALGMSAAVRNTSVSAIAENCIAVSWGTATLAGNELSGCGRRETEQAPRMAAAALPSPPSSEPSVRGRRIVLVARQGTRPSSSSTALARHTPGLAPAVLVRSTGEASARIATFRPAETLGSFRRRPWSRPVPPGGNPAPDTPSMSGALQALREPDRPAPSLLHSGTGGSAADPPPGEECARVPQVLESPRCPGLRKWRQEREPQASAGEQGPAPPGPWRRERGRLTAPG